MNLENEMIEQAAKEMAKSIDQELMAGLLIEDGWLEIVVDPWVHSSSKEINNWCDANCENHWFKAGNRWLFENDKDAIIFRLKWS